MSVLRVGTRGSDLARWQANWVGARLREAHPSLVIEFIVIETQGDVLKDVPRFGPESVGVFVGAIERALLERRVDVAVHSLKDLQTTPTPGLCIAATPLREVAHDVLLTQRHVSLGQLPSGARIGTGSPRRAAQLRRIGDFEIVPIRGNVPTRIAKMERDGLDGVVLAAAGLKRLDINHPCAIDLPTDVVVPAPGQGALAVQVRDGSSAAELAAVIDHAATRRAVTAERSFLHELGAGCHTPAGALGTVDGGTVALHGRVFSDDFARDVDGDEAGPDPEAVGVSLARRLQAELRGH